MDKGSYREAVDCFKRTLALNPGYKEAHYHLSTCYGKLGDVQRAEEHRRLWEAPTP